MSDKLKGIILKGVIFLINLLKSADLIALTVLNHIFILFSGVRYKKKQV